MWRFPWTDVDILPSTRARDPMAAHGRHQAARMQVVIVLVVVVVVVVV